MKFHFKSMQGIVNLSNKEAAAIIAKDRESHQKDLFENIERGNFPKWRFCVQIMPESEAASYKFNPFDLTKTWSHKDYPLIEVGILELNKNPENYFAEVEQAAFNPANIVPGVGYSPDKMLQGRLFSYGDTQRYRLGINHAQIPVNAPIAPVSNTHRDGYMQMGSFGGMRNYNPSYYNDYTESNQASEPPLHIKEGEIMDRYNHREYEEDHFSQAGDLYRLMSAEQKEILCQNIKEAMEGVPVEIKKRQIEHFKKADANYGKRVEELVL